MTPKKTQKLVYGVGINDLDEPVKVNGKYFKFYVVWTSMLQRCYSEKYQTKKPTYRGCSVCDGWLLLSNFKVWFDVNYREGMALDKDILVKGNKIYSPDTCRFVPQYINSLLCDSGAARGDLPLGVSAMKSKLKNGQITTTYEARCNDGHGSHPSETFKTIPEARQWYVTTKARIVKEQAAHALGAGDINGDVYKALIAREW